MGRKFLSNFGQGRLVNGNSKAMESEAESDDTGDWVGRELC